MEVSKISLILCSILGLALGQYYLKDQTIGCDGIIGSGQKLDRCGICGGSSNTCKVISGIYTKRSTRSQYDVITDFPVGAKNINITEARESRNYLALRYTDSQESILNGNWSLDWSGEYKAAGSRIIYSKPRRGKGGEMIHVDGPLEAKVQLLLLTQARNPGIYYSYAVPVLSRRAELLKQLLLERKNPAGQRTVSYAPRSPSSVGSRAHANSPIYLGDALGEKNRALFNYLNSIRQRNTLQNIPTLNGTLVAKPVPQTHKISLEGTGTDDETEDHPLSLMNHYSGKAVDKVGGDGRDTYRANSGGVSRLTSSRVQTYDWKVVESSACSTTCGGGTEQTNVVCTQMLTQITVTDENCYKYRKPIPAKVWCNTSPCPPNWTIGTWSDCSTTCGRGRQSRAVECKQKVGEGREEGVSASQCASNRKPSTVQMCQQKECFSWHTENWGKCSVKCGSGVKIRHVQCRDEQGNKVDKNMCVLDKPRHKEQCYATCERSWFFSDWEEKCSEDCRTGTITRQVYCPADTDHSQASLCGDKPITEKECVDNGPACTIGKWFTGEWERCIGDCKRANQTREVICMKKSGYWNTVTYERDCIADKKPVTEQKCRPEHCDSTEAKWFNTEWSQCSVTCGDGYERREVKCLTPDMTDSTNCTSRLKPDSARECAARPCPLVERPQSDPSCKDMYGSCTTVVQARLCRLSYYRSLCCASCTRNT